MFFSQVPTTCLLAFMHASAMGRPSGSQEQKLSQEEVAAVVEKIPVQQTQELVQTVGLADAQKLFNRSADDEVSVSRSYLQGKAWLLAPLLSASPVHTLHVDSTSGCNLVLYMDFLDLAY